MEIYLTIPNPSSRMIDISTYGKWQYKRYMVLPVLCECINNTEHMAVV